MTTVPTFTRPLVSFAAGVITLVLAAPVAAVPANTSDVAVSSAAPAGPDESAARPSPATETAPSATEPREPDTTDGDTATAPAGHANETTAAAASASASAQSAAQDDMVLNPAEPDFTLVNMPTGLRLARNKFAFRVTHRFNRPLGQGDFGDLLSDFFGFDSGALIGLELRFGFWHGLQGGIYRTSNRTIQFFSEYSVLQQGERSPVSVSAWLTAEGTNNFRDSYSPAIGAVVSRTIREHAALYVTPLWINNTNPLPGELSDDNSSFVLGLGTRVRVRPTLYVVAEITPRLAGYVSPQNPGDPNSPESKALMSFAVEKRVGGHAFQINFSNGIGSSMAQVARSFADNDNWFIGFNISRKFY